MKKYAKGKISSLFLIGALLSGVLTGCGQEAPVEVPEQSPVSVEKIDETYFLTQIDMTQLTHTQMGEEYAKAIVATFPEYEMHVDSMLQDQFAALAKVKEVLGYDLNFELCLARANDIIANVQPEYQEEIAGMTNVFNYDQDILGDGKLSKNEMLVLQVFADVMRPTQCSGAAAFGEASATGETILGRNLDWDLLPHEDASLLHSVAVLKNGEKSLVMIGILGTLVPFSGFSDDNVFVACLDAETDAPYPDTKDKNSYLFDFRYALENETTLDGVANFIASRPYTFNHVVLMADKAVAKVLENNIGSPGRGLRSWDSQLHPGIIWGIKDTIAVVNDFRLKDNFQMLPLDAIDTIRWETYRNNITAALADGKKIDAPAMEKIVGFSGTDGKPLPSGAVFRTDHISTLQSVIVSMDTLETKVAFKPYKEAPMTPNYVQVFSSNPFVAE